MPGDWKPPTPGELRVLQRMLAPIELLARPLILGMDKVPADRPLMFVGNHTVYGLLDIPFLVMALQREHGIFLRGLGDHVHFKVPGWGRVLSRYGAVDGTRANCAALLEAGETVLVFPGGAREVAKRKHQRYQLLWKERVGFVRMALAHGATLVPFSAVGVDDAFEFLADGDDIMATPVGKLLERFGVRGDAVLPIAKSFEPQRIYFRIGDPIRAAGLTSDDATVLELRDRVRAAVEQGIEWLMDYRERDPDRAPVKHLARKLGVAKEAR